MNEELPLKVSKERWLLAQEWELSHWLKENHFLVKTPIRRLKKLIRWILRIPSSQAGEGDDWNLWWLEQFENYQVLPKKVNRAIELGCGPYTNIRLILEKTQALEVYCSDPLVLEYLKFEGRWLSNAVKCGKAKAIQHRMEECPFPDGHFELVVVVNVLDHVQDAEACMKEAKRITQKGGYLVIGQELTDASDLERLPEILARHGMVNDIGHPIRPSSEFMKQQVAEQFEVLFSKILPREAGREPEAHCGTFLFIGKKLSS